MDAWASMYRILMVSTTVHYFYTCFNMFQCVLAFLACEIDDTVVAWGKRLHSWRWFAKSDERWYSGLKLVSWWDTKLNWNAGFFFLKPSQIPSSHYWFSVLLYTTQEQMWPVIYFKPFIFSLHGCLTEFVQFWNMRNRLRCQNVPLRGGSVKNCAEVICDLTLKPSHQICSDCILATSWGVYVNILAMLIVAKLDETIADWEYNTSCK